MVIDKKSIVAASIAILNRDGIDKLNMRSIASELNIKAASLYNHIANKDELYSEIAEIVSADYDHLEQYAKLSAREFLIENSQNQRQMRLSVRDILSIFDNTLPTTPIRAKQLRGVTEKLRELGVTGLEVMTISNMINDYIDSFVALELRVKAMPSDELTAFAQQMLPDMLNFSKRASFDFDQQFLLGLNIILDGIEAMVKKKA